MKIIISLCSHQFQEPTRPLHNRCGLLCSHGCVQVLAARNCKWSDHSTLKQFFHPASPMGTLETLSWCWDRRYLQTISAPNDAQFCSGDRSSRRAGTDRVLTSRHPRRWDRSWVLLVLPHCQLSVIWSPWTYSLLGTELNTLFPIPDAISLWSGLVKCGVFKWKP